MTKKNEFLQLKEQERDVRRNLIMDAAERVFAGKTFDKVNMREIAKEAGISPGTIYTYFTDQETLFVEASMRGAEHLITEVGKVAAQENPTVENAAKAYIDFIMDHYEYIRMMQHCMLYGKFNSDDSLSRLFIVYRKLFNQFDKVLETKVPAGTLRLDTHLLFSTINGIIFSFGRFPRRSEEEVRIYMNRLVKRLSEIYKGYAGSVNGK